MFEQLTAMPKYEAYKDSGVEWLGKIPEHWQIKALKHIAFMKSGETISPEQFTEDGFPVFGGNGFRGYTKTFTNEGCFALIGRQGALCGNVNYAKGRFFASEHAIVVCPLNGESYFWLGESIRLADLNRFSQSAAQPGIAVNTIKNILFPYPPLPEQTAIAVFLDRKIAQIDQAVTIKEKQIALLKEHKQILIQNAVTRGLNPDAMMRDSGVEWIGKIPAHWIVKRGKYLFKEIDERSLSGEEELLSVSHMTGITPRSEKNVTMFMAEDYTGSKTCQKGDLVFNIMWAWMGALGVSDRSGIVSSSYGVFRQLKGNTFNSKYLEFLLKTTGYVEHYNKVSTGLHSSRLRFYSHMFFDMELGLPSKEEQNEIVAHIEAESAKIDRAISIQQQQIDKLKEYKATLINNAVTGKIRVPELSEGSVPELVDSLVA
jgi:type I restriction enzyme S subunit